MSPEKTSSKIARRPARDLWRYIVVFALLGATIWAPSAKAQAWVGLSSVRSRALLNENLLFFVPQASDQFGSALAAGDFNGDGAEDLAIGIPGDDGLAGFEVTDSGIVVVRYGQVLLGLEEGLADTVVSYWSSGSAWAPGLRDRLGSALASGDFNGDGYDDLAIGVPHRIAGAVAIHYGSPGGLLYVAEHNLSPGVGGVPGFNVALGSFGSVLSAGNFNADGYDDLAIGAPFVDNECGTVPCRNGEGRVVVSYGHAGGFGPFTGVEIRQNSAGILDSEEPEDRFGAALAAGDFNSDGRDDLAVGVPGEGLVGAIQVIYGSGSGLDLSLNLIRFESDLGGTSEFEDDFGCALSSGDFDGDGRDDLAIGARLENLGLAENAGEVTVLYGSAWPEGFNPSKTDHITQGSLFGSAANESFDWFGSALASGDFDGDGEDDLVIGIPGEDFPAGNLNQGGWVVLTGSPAGAGEHFRFMAGNSGGIAAFPDFGSCNTGDAFAAGDFDGDGFADLAVGAPLVSIAGIGDSVGGALALYGAAFAEGFDFGNLFAWSLTSP